MFALWPEAALGPGQLRRTWSLLPEATSQEDEAPALFHLSRPSRGHKATQTCLEDLVAQGEARSLPGIVGRELDVEHGPRGDDGGRRDVPAVLAQEVGGLAVPIPDLDEVIPGWGCKKRAQGAKVSLSGGNRRTPPSAFPIPLDWVRCFSKVHLRPPGCWPCQRPQPQEVALLGLSLIEWV